MSSGGDSQELGFISSEAGLGASIANNPIAQETSPSEILTNNSCSTNKNSKTEMTKRTVIKQKTPLAFFFKFHWNTKKKKSLGIWHQMKAMTVRLWFPLYAQSRVEHHRINFTSKQIAPPLVSKPQTKRPLVKPQVVFPITTELKCIERRWLTSPRLLNFSCG